MKSALTTLHAALCATLGCLLLGACANTPPAPNWQGSAFAALNAYSSAYLSGNSRVAQLEFDRAQADIASTGRADLMARLQLVRCATELASLVLQPCTGYLALAQDAQPPEQAYAAFLSGQWADLDPALLPAGYQTWIAQNTALAPVGQTPTAANTKPLLGQITDPLSRLIAAGVLLKREQLTQTEIGLAVETASNQGWRRPLLAWLGVQLKNAQVAGQTAQAARLQRRIDLVLQGAPAR